MPSDNKTPVNEVEEAQSASVEAADVADAPEVAGENRDEQPDGPETGRLNTKRRPNGCPYCDSSVYSYCSDKLLHDACCCLDPHGEYYLNRKRAFIFYFYHGLLFSQYTEIIEITNVKYKKSLVGGREYRMRIDDRDHQFTVLILCDFSPDDMKFFFKFPE